MLGCTPWGGMLGCAPGWDARLVEVWYPGECFPSKDKRATFFFFFFSPKKVKTNVKTNCTLTHTCLAYKKKAE